MNAFKKAKEARKKKLIPSSVEGLFFRRPTFDEVKEIKAIAVAVDEEEAGWATIVWCALNLLKEEDGSPAISDEEEIGDASTDLIKDIGEDIRKILEGNAPTPTGEESSS